MERRGEGEAEGRDEEKERRREGIVIIGRSYEENARFKVANR